jgi:hypothetical protein
LRNEIGNSIEVIFASGLNIVDLFCKIKDMWEKDK